MHDIQFRAYLPVDRSACLRIFDANCPEFFAPNERDDFTFFLDSAPAGYEVCEIAGVVCGAFGLISSGDGEGRINWILLDPTAQGTGIGSAMMKHTLDKSRVSGTRLIHIAASQKSEKFFARFGATPESRTRDGWGPGMDRVDMVLRL